MRKIAEHQARRRTNERCLRQRNAVTARTHASTGTAEAVKAVTTALASQAVQLRWQISQLMVQIRAA